MSQPVNVSFLVEPVEPLTFGPPRSFTAGEAHRSRSRFPPTPFAFQGMVRSQLLRGAEPPLDLDDWSEAARRERAALVGEPDALPAGWQLRGPYPARWVEDPEGAEPVLEPWVAAPAFLLGHRGAAVHAREVISSQPFAWDLQRSPQDEPLVFGRPVLGAVQPLGGWIGPENLRFALAGEDAGCWRAEQWRRDLPPFVHREQQPGLAIDRASGSARHGMLYFLGALRFDRGSGLLGVLRADLAPALGPACLSEGAGSAGRKGRLVLFGRGEPVHPLWQQVLDGKHLPDEVEDGARFWLLSLAPARVANPLEPELDVRVTGGAQIRVLAALTGRPAPIGGYQIATGRPRPNRLHVPAGSAWLLRVTGGTPADRAAALRALHDAHPLGPREEAAFGFGHTLVGLGPRTTEEGP